MKLARARYQWAERAYRPGAPLPEELRALAAAGAAAVGVEFDPAAAIVTERSCRAKPTF